MNTSADGGFLFSPFQPDEDDALHDLLQSVVAGVTGLPGSMVRPRYQPEPPNLPDFGANWAAIGIVESAADTFAAIEHTGDLDGYDTLIRQEQFDLLCSFYGPRSGALASSLRDGLQIAQNREALLRAGIGVVECSNRVRAPQLLKERWTDRYDVTLTLRRRVQRYYGVLNVLEADLSVTPDHGTGVMPSAQGLTFVGVGPLDFNPLTYTGVTAPQPAPILITTGD